VAVGPISILFVEEDVSEQVLVERFMRGLGSGYKMYTVGSTYAAVNILKRTQYDVAIIDYRFSDGTAFDLLNELGETPAIFLTEDGQEEIAAMVLKRGAYDYVMKDRNRNYLMLLPGTIQKVLNRKRAEQALQQSESRCQDVLEFVLDMYFCISEDGSILLANRAGAYQLGYSVSEMLGMSLSKLVYPSDVELLKRELLLATTSADESRRSFFRVVSKDGRIIHVCADIQAQAERGRQIPVIRLLCRDITGKTSSRMEVSGGNGACAVNSRMPVSTQTAMTGSVSTSEISAELTGRERLLIIDDEPDQRAVSARMLAKLGYRVVTAENGHAALELMRAGDGTRQGEERKSPFALVLLDMSMEKGFDGLDTYQEMVKLYPGQRCIIVSGCCEAERLEKAQALGAGEFVSKPYTFQSLGRAVRKELDKIPQRG